MPQQRTRNFGQQNPAFQVHRFKRTILVVMNEEEAESLEQFLARQPELPPHLYALRERLTGRLDQQSPAASEGVAERIEPAPSYGSTKVG